MLTTALTVCKARVPPVTRAERTLDLHPVLQMSAKTPPMPGPLVQAPAQPANKLKRLPAYLDISNTSDKPTMTAPIKATKRVHESHLLLPPERLFDDTEQGDHDITDEETQSMSTQGSGTPDEEVLPRKRTRHANVLKDEDEPTVAPTPKTMLSANSSGGKTRAKASDYD
ncbi:hypothetical protein OG21DRAFT_1488361, partial [Imleria badia]